MKNILHKIRTRIRWSFIIMWWVFGITFFIMDGHKSGITVPLFWTVVAFIMALMKPAHVDAFIYPQNQPGKTPEQIKKTKRKKKLDNFFKHN